MVTLDGGVSTEVGDMTEGEVLNGIVIERWDSLGGIVLNLVPLVLLSLNLTHPGLSFSDRLD